MTPKDFAIGMMRGVVDENVAAYREMFTNSSLTKAVDPYGRRALTLFASLSEDQREVFFEVIRQASVDMTSNLLGVLDGINAIEGIDSDLVVIDATGQRLNGDLQSYFLVEDEGKIR
jgi:hypothetical protein